MNAWKGNILISVFAIGIAGVGHAQTNGLCYSAAGRATTIQSNDNDMSIPYFPLQVGDEFVFYDYGTEGYGEGSDFSDTIANGNLYILNNGIPPYFTQGMRTNNKDSVWALNKFPYPGPNNYLYEELSDNPLRDSAKVYQISGVFRNQSWQTVFDTLYRTAIDTTSGYMFDSLVRIKYISYVDSSGNKYERWYANRFGITKYVTTINGPVDPNVHEEDLAYCEINGKQYGTNPLSVDSHNDAPTTAAGISCYPNPTHDIAFVRVDGIAPDAQVQIMITDMLGNIVLSRNFLLGRNNNLTLFDGSELRQGVYFVSVFNRDIHLTKKIFLIK